MTGRGPYALAVVLLLAGCGTTGAPLRSEARAASARADPAGTWTAADWPDACALARPSGGAAPSGPTPAPPAPGTPSGATSCGWVPRDDDGARLDVLVVSEDVEAVWSGHLFHNPLRRNVSGLGRRAFLATGDDGARRLWVCQGRTIFVVVGGAASAEVDESLVQDGLAAVEVLRSHPAGTPLGE